MDINTIALLALILAVIVSVFIILSLRSLTRLLQESTNSITVLTNDISKNLNTLTNDFSDMKNKLTETLANVNVATNQLTTTAKTIDNEVQKTYEIIESVQSVVDIVTKKIYPPLNYIATLFSASSKAANTFLNFFSKK